MTPRRGRRAGGGESPTEKLLRLERSGGPVVKVNVGGITPGRRAGADEAPPEGSEPTSPETADREPDADRD
jgi:hypothetical protein